MKHTDTPWNVTGAGKDAIYCVDGRFVADTETSFRQDEEDAANAEFIVKAVNSYYPMIEALEYALREMALTFNSDNPAASKMREALSLAKST